MHSRIRHDFEILCLNVAGISTEHKRIVFWSCWVLKHYPSLMWRRLRHMRDVRCEIVNLAAGKKGQVWMSLSGEGLTWSSPKSEEYTRNEITCTP